MLDKSLAEHLSVMGAVVVEGAKWCGKTTTCKRFAKSVLDLSDPEIAEKIQIVDTMKTMDNRIHIDEETLQKFQSDENLNKTLEKFRRARARAEARGAKIS